MTSAPETRKTHVIRILGTNKNEDILPDLWADVERIDEAKSVYQSDLTSFQGTVKRLKWSDDPDQDDYNPDGTPSRKTKIVKVCSPDEADQSDPEEWIPIPVIDKMRGLQGDQGEVERFINDQETGARKVEQRRILHYDTNIDEKAQAAFDADPTRKAFVVPGDQYTRDDSTKDDSQFLEHEVITFLKGRVNNETGTGQGDDQGEQTKLLNQYLIDESEPAQLEVTGTNGFNPPWRLDPYQNIVNVQLGGATQFDAFSDSSYIGAPSGAGSTSRLTVVAAVRFLTPEEIKLSGSPIPGPPLSDAAGGLLSFVYVDPLGGTPTAAFNLFVGDGSIFFSMTGNSYQTVDGVSRAPDFDPSEGDTVEFLTMPSAQFGVSSSFVGPDSMDTLRDGHYHLFVFSVDASGPSSASLGAINDGSTPPVSVNLGKFNAGITLKASIDNVRLTKNDTAICWEGSFPPDKTWPQKLRNNPANDPDHTASASAFPSYRQTFYSAEDAPGSDTLINYFEFFNFPPVVADLGATRVYVSGSNIAIASLQVFDSYIDPTGGGPFYVGKDKNGELIMRDPKVIAAVLRPIIWCQGVPDQFMKNRGSTSDFLNKVGYVRPYSKRPRFQS